MKIQLYYSYLPASLLFKESIDILMSPEPSTSTQNHEVMCRLYHSTRGGHTQQPTNTMSTESTQYPQD